MKSIHKALHKYLFNITCQKTFFACTFHDRFQVNIYSAHVLISITFTVFEFLDTALAMENKILRFSKAVLPYKTRTVNPALILFFHYHRSYKRVTWKKEGVATRSIPRLKRAWLISWVMNSYVLAKSNFWNLLEGRSFFRIQRRMIQADREIKSVLVTFVFTEILVIWSSQMLTMKMAELGQKTEDKIY